MSANEKEFDWINGNMTDFLESKGYILGFAIDGIHPVPETPS